ncbi:hypothetical protein GD605_14545 [Desulfolutivibrio sulfoxidireducens]|nr:hypothetical protein GD605_14545 [Desulfolutivibrio sulfoxidireducens]
MNSTAKHPKPLDRINLRLSPGVFALIDQARSTRLGNVSRNTWIAEAIQEKLARELRNQNEWAKAAQGGG